MNPPVSRVVDLQWWRMKFASFAGRTKLRIDEAAGERVVLRDAVRLRESRVGELHERFVEQRGTQPAIAVFRENAWAGKEIRFRPGPAAQGRCRDDAQAVKNDDRWNGFPLESLMQLQLKTVAEKQMVLGPLVIH